MSFFKLFIKSNDLTANMRLFVVSVIISPLMQILFIFGMASSVSTDAVSYLPYICSTSIFGFGITLFASAITSDRMALLFSQFLIGGNYIKYLLSRFLPVILITSIFAFLQFFILFIFTAIFHIGTLSLSLSNIIQLFFMAILSGTAMGWALSILSITFSDPYKAVNILMPFLPILLPVLAPAEKIPFGLNFVSHIIPLSATMNAVRIDDRLDTALAFDFLVICVWLAIGYLGFRHALTQIQQSGKAETIYS